jgi:hypothetical protein
MLDLAYDVKCYGYIVICYCTDLVLDMLCDVNKRNELIHITF